MKTKYFDPRTGLWTDECPWPAGKMPDGARIVVDAFTMDSHKAPVSTAPADYVSDQERAAFAQVQAWEDHFTEQRQRPALSVWGPASDSYNNYVKRLQRGAA